MKPSMLSMTAFGPYAHTEVIDFSALGANTLFLVSGETGSGKTAILDAMCFALFGEASGRDRSGKSLRSDHAPGDRPTAVKLEFLLGKERYRVCRTPEQLRPKKRGDGFTRSPASATLETWQNDDWSVMETGGSAVSDQIEKRLGFGPSQFRQLVVLPQGDFRSLLTAKSNEREAILARLFNTKRYRTLQKALDEQAKLLKRELEDADGKRNTLLEHVQVENINALKDLLNQSGEQLAAFEKQDALLNDQVTQKRDALEEARNIDRKLQEAIAAKENVERLVEKQAQIEVDRQRLHAANQAAELQDVERFLQDRNRELVDERRKLELADANRDAAAAEHTTAQANLAKEQEREPLRLVADRRLQQLVQLMESSDERIRAHEQVVTLDEQLKTAKTQAAAKQEQIESQRSLVEDARIALETATSAASMAEHLRATIQQIEQARADIATLAQGLTDGAPCPVCGSLEHPEPATHAQPKTDPKLVEYQSQLENTLAVASQREQADARLQQSTTRLQQSEVEQNQLQQTLNELAEAHTKATITRELLLKELPEELQEPGAIENAHQEATIHFQSMQDAWQQAQKRLQSAESKNNEAEVRIELQQNAVALAEQRRLAQHVELEKRITEAGFSGTDAFHAAKLPHEQRNKMSKDIDQWDTAMAKASDRLQRAIQEAESLQPPDLEALQAQFDAITETAKVHQAQTAAHRKQVDEQNRVLARVTDIEKTQAKQRKQYSVVGRLADTANGKNAHLITFERFVQAELLDRILHAANLRFHPMTEGRYRLQRSTNPQDRRRGAGLDLEVFDQNTGVARPAATLSGGEGFEACLALALGMADVVQAQSGGIHLDSIFVDEGFGSLGGQDLDRVVQTLQSLQAGGRLVGVISHVRELGERIDARLEVHKAKDGSRTKFVVP